MYASTSYVQFVHFTYKEVYVRTYYVLPIAKMSTPCEITSNLSWVPSTWCCQGLDADSSIGNWSSLKYRFQALFSQEHFTKLVNHKNHRKKVYDRVSPFSAATSLQIWGSGGCSLPRSRHCCCWPCCLWTHKDLPLCEHRCRRAVETAQTGPTRPTHPACQQQWATVIRIPRNIWLLFSYLLFACP